MASVDYTLDSLTEPLPQGNDAPIESYYTFETDWIQHTEPVTGVFVRNQLRPDGQHGRMVLGYTHKKFSKTRTCREFIEKYCKHCNKPLPVGRNFFGQSHCCIKAYLFNAQRHIQRCMMEMQVAEKQRLRCRSLLDSGHVTMIVELQFSFDDGLMKQMFVTANDYYAILRRSVTKEDLQTWSLPFAPLSKIHFLTYPAQCKFIHRMYTDCAGSGLLPNFDASARQPVRLAIRETDGRPEITKVAMDPISQITQETSSKKITDDL